MQSLQKIIKKIIKKWEIFNYVFDNEIEKTLKNSIFEYKIINGRKR